MVEEILKEADFVQWRGVRILLSILANLCDPIQWLPGIADIEQLVWIQIRLAGIVHETVVVRFYSDNEVGLTLREIRIVRGC